MPFLLPTKCLYIFIVIFFPLKECSVLASFLNCCKDDSFINMSITYKSNPYILSICQKCLAHSQAFFSSKWTLKSAWRLSLTILLNRDWDCTECMDCPGKVCHFYDFYDMPLHLGAWYSGLFLWPWVKSYSCPHAGIITQALWDLILGILWVLWLLQVGTFPSLYFFK